MVEIGLTCYLKGDEFSEKDIEKKTSLVFEKVRNYKKRKLSVKTFTKVISIVPEMNGINEDDYNLQIEKFSKLINNKISIIKKLGCESIVLLMEVNYVDQCNLSLKKSTLHSIANSFDDFDISCYEVEQFDKI